MKRTSAFLTLRFLVLGLATTLLTSAVPVQAQQIDPDVRKLLERERRVKGVIAKVSKSVVALTDGTGWGSGVIVSGDGLIMTAGHVSLETKTGTMEVWLSDGRSVKAKCLGRNLKTDSALLLLESKTDAGKPWPAVPLGSSASLRRGDWTLSMGHPGGREENRPAPVRLGRILSVGSRTIVTDGTIIVGDSGGPLFDLDGRLIGIHSMIGNDITNNRHVAIDVIRRDRARLEDNETWGRLGDFNTGLIGSSLFGTRLDWDMYEAVVRSVAADSPADRAGIRAGDQLVAVDGQKIADALELSLILGERNSGDVIRTEVARGRERLDLQVRLGQFPKRTRTETLPARRKPGKYEKASTYALVEFRPATRKNRGSTVRFFDAVRPDRQLSLGTVVGSKYVVSKYSEIDSTQNLVCELANGVEVPATIVAYEERFDLALIEVKTNAMQPVDWQDEESSVGQLLVSPSQAGSPVAIGVVSVPARKLDETAFLGVQVGSDRRRAGAVVNEVVEDSAAQRMGLRKDDRILEINSRTIRGHRHLVTRIKGFRPGDKVKLKIERPTGEFSVEIIDLDVMLSSRFVAGDWQQSFQEQNLMGPKLSEHAAGFPGLVLQHDTVLKANECGGPLLNVEGKTVGINIARAGRVMSYAIPAREARKLIAELISQVK